MIENYDTGDASTTTNTTKHPDFTPSRRANTEDVSHNEFILWGYKVIENEDQSKQSMLMPIYRVMPSTSSITRSTTDEYSPTPLLSMPTSLPSVPSSSSSSTTASIQVSTPSSVFIQPPLLSRFPSSANDSHDQRDAQNDDGQSQQQRQKPVRQQYSPEVTKYLKQVFVDTVGNDRKLTKSLRKKIMHETGLNSRSLTYWFSNRKRRPPFLAQQFKDSVKQSHGQVKTYEDFELWWALSKKKK